MINDVVTISGFVNEYVYARRDIIMYTVNK